MGMIGFGTLALLVLYVDLIWAGYLIAAALLTHAVWDAVHLWRCRKSHTMNPARDRLVHVLTVD